MDISACLPFARKTGNKSLNIKGFEKLPVFIEKQAHYR